MSYRKESTIGRPRDPDREAEILRCVLAVLGERGYDGVTFEEVARRASASKATLYRRWPTRRDMVVAALRSGPAPDRPAEDIDTGSLVGDLTALCRRLAATMWAADARVALLLLQAGLQEPELCDRIESSLGPTGARLPGSVVDRAVQRGELPAGVDPFPFEEVVGSSLLLRRLNGLRVDDAHIDALVTTVLLPALRATPVADRPLPPGIFSGHPEPHVAAPIEETS